MLNVRHLANVWLTQQQVAVAQYEGSTQDPCGVIAAMYGTYLNLSAYLRPWVM